MHNFIAFIVSFFLLSVNSVYSQDSKSKGSLEMSFKGMLESNSYKEFENLAKLFIEKERAIDIDKSLAYENAFLKKLEKRIPYTGFMDFEEAKKEYDTLKAKFELVKKENVTFFEELKKSEFWDLAELMTPKQNDTLTENCKVCSKNFHHTLKVAAFNYENILKYKEYSAVSGWLYYQRIKTVLEDTYVLCVIGCKG